MGRYQRWQAHTKEIDFCTSLYRARNPEMNGLLCAKSGSPDPRSRSNIFFIQIPVTVAYFPYLY